ncbi:hypothetical protein GIB67_026997 [Kingdonia uniflora]|uniref:Uncharacterized protein n=1 Tax=Kingdonia uniflora TaxID=39325 RepID=A0A7J7P242_9MAGN|nr:hypothetical protein GIB67_026997 [Kingdonia uniflora]
MGTIFVKLDQASGYSLDQSVPGFLTHGANVRTLFFIPRNFNLTEDKSSTGFRLYHTFPQFRMGIKGMIVFTTSSSPTILTRFRTPVILSEVIRCRAVLCIRSR